MGQSWVLEQSWEIPEEQIVDTRGDKQTHCCGVTERNGFLCGPREDHAELSVTRRGPGGC